jgi:anti-anti-sigma factor
MGIQQWDDETLVVRLADDPDLSDDMSELDLRLRGGCCNLVLDLSDLTVITSSGVSKLLKLRRLAREHQRRMVLCSLNDTVWSLFINTGLDRLFEFVRNVSEALATLEGGKR